MGQLRRVLTGSRILQIVFSGTLAVGAGFPAILRFVEHIHQLFRLVEQGNILGILDIRRRTGRVYDERAAVPVVAARIIVMLKREVQFNIDFLCYKV